MLFVIHKTVTFVILYLMAVTITICALHGNFEIQKFLPLQKSTYFNKRQRLMIEFLRNLFGKTKRFRPDNYL